MQRSEAVPAAARRAVVPLIALAVGHFVLWGALAGLPYQAHPNAMHGWLDLPEEWPGDSFALQARIRGVAVCPASSFQLARNIRNGVRISLTAPCSIDTVARGLDIVARLAREKPRPDFNLV